MIMISRILWRLGVVIAGMWFAAWGFLSSVMATQSDADFTSYTALCGALVILAIGAGFAWAFQRPQPEPSELRTEPRSIAKEIIEWTISPLFILLVFIGFVYPDETEFLAAWEDGTLPALIVLMTISTLATWGFTTLKREKDRLDHSSYHWSKGSGAE
jgi:hypothetical protein